MKNLSFLAVAVGLTAWLVGMHSAVAQQPPETSGAAAHMIVTVEAHHGANVPAIHKEDVMVSEGKTRDTVTDWVPAQGDQAGLELVILLDDGSNSTVGTQLEDIRQFINGQPASTKIGVAYMQNGIARFVQDVTADHAAAAKSLRLPMGLPGANASPYISLSDLIKRWPQSSERREVLMVSDGIDRYYGSGDLQDPYLETAIEDAQRTGIVVFTLYSPGVGHFGHSYWQTYWGQLYLGQLADKTGGEDYYFGFNGPPVAFAPYLDNLAHRLTHQYLLTFIPKPQKKAGFQKVKVATEVQGVDLVAPEDVYVPAAP